MNNGIRSLISQIGNIGIVSSEHEEMRLKKSMLTICAFTFAILGLVWGVLYMLVGQHYSAVIPLIYSAVSYISIFHYAKTKHYKFFRFSQLMLILVLPFLLLVSLGGFTNGSVVILWSLICPMGALLFDRPKYAMNWFVAFLLLVVAGGIFQERFQLAETLSHNTVMFFFVLNLVGVGFMIFLLVSYFVDKKNVFQKKSEDLLLNIMPKDIVPKLKEKHGTVAEHYKDTSILFADIVDFTPLASSLSAKDLVTLLNEVFSYFDGLVDKYDLEKIKTIGDCYMVASGVPRPRKDHAQSIVKMAKEMMEYVNDRKLLTTNLHLRVGISSGDVVAGVIGNRKFAYDMWGDTVNIASRMESHGKPGKIQISKYTYDLIKDDFNCVSGGSIKVKGKGEMEVWFVEASEANPQ